MRVLVTGGGKGIGRAIALELAQPGSEIFINYRSDDEAAGQVIRAVEERGAAGHAIAADVADVGQLEQLIAEIRHHTTTLDCIVHCAVQAWRADALEMDHTAFAAAVAANGASLLHLVRAAQPLLQRGSSICVLSSHGTFRPAAGYAAIGPPKALAESLARYLALELAPSGVRVNVVTCGPIVTQAARSLFPDAVTRDTPLGRPLAPSDVAKLVAFLATPQAEMITGQTLRVDGGSSLVG